MNQTNQHGQKSGLKCPQCGNFIETSVSELLHAQSLRCSYCHLVLTINRQESKQAMEILKKVDDASKNLEKASSFKR